VVPSPVADMGGMPEHTELYEQVVALTRPEMDELSIRLGAGVEYLPGPGAPPVSVALAIVQICGQRADGLAKLAAALEEQSSKRHADRRRYTSWVKARAATYTAFGIERPISIETTWIPLQVREAERHDRAIAEDTRTWWRRPREWDRLASPDWRGQGYDARNVADYSMRNVVYAGPGLGKSMLLRRMAYDRSKADQFVLWVRLPRIADVLARQGTFEAALSEVAADGSGLSSSSILRLGTPTILLADGLDECGGRMAQIATHLRDWAMGHPTIPIVVTTRPAGYSSSLFPEWRHVELLPLDPPDVVEHATHILRAGGLEEAVARAQALSFRDRLSGHRIAFMASRSPLLLRFLLRSFLEGDDIGATRVALFDQVIRHFQRQLLSDREPGPEVDRAVAQAVLEEFAGQWMRAPDVDEDELHSKVSEALARDLGEPKLQASQIVGRALAHWTACRVIDRVTVGGKQRIEFVHQQVAEFAAAGWLLRASALAERVTEFSGIPKWREVIALAVGRGDILKATTIVESLLLRNDANDPLGTEAVLAAIALAEREVPEPELITQVVAHLRERLRSTVPYLAYEATEGLVTLAARAPTLIGPLVAELVGDKQVWTQLCGHRLALACGPPHIVWPPLLEQLRRLTARRSEEKEVRGFPRRLRQSHRLPDHEIKKDLLLATVERAIDYPSPELEHAIFELLAECQLAVGEHTDLVALLARRARPDLAKALERSYLQRLHGGMRDVDLSLTGGRGDWDDKLLVALVRAAGGPPAASLATVAEGLPAISRLLSALGFWDTPADLPPDVWCLPAVEDAVLRGAIAATALDPAQVACEAVWAHDHLSSTLPEHALGLLGLLDLAPAFAEWNRANSIALPVDTLVDGLRHPLPFIASGAASLLVSSPDREAVRVRVEPLLNTKPDGVITLAADVLRRIAGSAAVQPVLSRAAVLDKAAAHLLPSLAQWEPDDERVLDLLIRAVRGTSRQVAQSAAEALEMMRAIPERRIPELSATFEEWETVDMEAERVAREQENIAPPDSVRIRNIPPSPRPRLFRFLARRGRWTEDELLTRATSDGDLAQSALVALAELYGASALERFLSLLESSPDASRHLDRLLRLEDDTIRPIARMLLRLLESRDPELRAGVLETLLRGLLPRDEAIQVAKNAVVDSDHQVRSLAVDVLRQLTARQLPE
jgi:hypothetical protein